MTKKLISFLLALLMAVTCASFTVSAADDNVFYVEEGGTGDGSDDDPFGELSDAIAALDGKSGTIYIYGVYDVTEFNPGLEWDEMITIEGANADAMLHLDASAAAVFTGPVTLKNIGYDIGENAHVNPVGPFSVLDGGKNSNLNGIVHFPTYKDSINEGDACLEIESGIFSYVFLGGAYNSTYACGVMGDSTFILNGGSVRQLCLSVDGFMDTHTGITIGGNMNIILNGGMVTEMYLKRETYQPDVLGALNIIFNNGMEALTKLEYPENVTMGTFVIYSDKGGTVMPTKEPGIFEIKADAGKVAVIDDEQVFDGNVELPEGVTRVTWVDGEQPEKAPEEEPIEIKLVIGSAELVKNGETTALDVPAQIIDDRTMVPLRAIFEALGASVEWDDATKTVTSVKDDTTVKLTIGENKLTVNGEEKTLDVPGQIVESRTLVPARAVAESFGCTVEWDAPTQTVTITK